ncbi:hypothetical protein BDN72DRAFT_962262 [Pluteus cervinus]|uniref:Uncharacterized protein n=1 Tax=Pluteus cervinus TaxID=181527 RepID=A0ACD3AJC6_9AGAR|nr:hypothetical protein BDN72DRAFT_962262 [Pluteus cervinus]
MAPLPPELIQEIIEIYVEGSLTRAASIAGVCRDFNDCVRPVLSRTLMYYQTEPLWQWPVPVHELPQWLEKNGKYCPGIINLAVWVNTSANDLTTLLPSLSTLRLLSLSINLYELFNRRKFLKHEAQNDVFRTITHLDVIHSILGWEDIEGIAFFPCLTHLCLPELMSHPSYRSDILRALRDCKQLRVLVIIAGSFVPDQDIRVVRANRLFNRDGDDPRIVELEREYVDDWEKGATGKKDMWALADEIVERRLVDRRDKEKRNIF